MSQATLLPEPFIEPPRTAPGVTEQLVAILTENTVTAAILEDIIADNPYVWGVRSVIRRRVRLCRHPLQCDVTILVSATNNGDTTVSLVDTATGDGVIVCLIGMKGSNPWLLHFKLLMPLVRRRSVLLIKDGYYPGEVPGLSIPE